MPHVPRLARLAVAAVLGVPTSALASQFVVTEVTYTHSGTTTTDSHLRLVPSAETPPNWKAPVDYAATGGTAHVRLQVFTKPTAAATRFQICFEASPSYACTNQSPPYTTTGIYDWATPFPSFYQFNQVDWSKGVVKVALILKDANNVKPSPENVGATVSAMYMPTDLRATVTIVSPGGTYVPPTDPPIDPPDAGVDAGTGPDASPPGDGGPPTAGSDASGGGCATAPGAGGSTAALLGIGSVVALLARRRRVSSRCAPTRRSTDSKLR